MNAHGPTPQLGTTRYRLLSVLGEGAMATVYRARDTVLGVDRAIKVMRPKIVRNQEARLRFLNEARVMATLAHPNVVRVVDAQLEGDTPYLVMELVPGGSLDLHVQHAKQIHPGLAIRLVRDLLAGLGAAHEKGVVHRDVKPQNVLLTLDGKAKVTDFGVAHVSDGHHGLTRTGTSLGTLAYLAPEQRVDASSADHRADIFAAGATLYHLVSGREPFDLYSNELREQNYKGLPTKLAKVIAKACAYEPADRYASAEEMAVALDQVSWSIPRKKGAKEAMLAWAETVAAEQASAEELPPPAAEGLTTPPAWGWDPSGSGGPQPEEEEEVAEGTLGPQDAGLPPWLAVLAGGLLALFLAGTVLVLVILYGLKARDAETVAPEPVELAEALDGLPEPEVALPVAEPIPAEEPEEPEEPEEQVEQAAPVAEPTPERTVERVVAPVERPEPAPEPVEPEPVASATEPVRSFLNSRPWSRVELDGIEVGRTVYAVKLSAGAHTLRLTTGDGRTHEATITAVDGESLRYCWDFELDGPCVR